MAIAVQTSGADGPSSNGSTSSSRSVTLAAGGSRLLVVAVCSEGSGSGTTTVTSVTYGGQSLSRITDGTDSAQVADVPCLEWWCLRDALMPADGSNSLVVNVSAGRSHGVGWYILTGASQAANISDVTGTVTNTGALSVQVSPQLTASGSFVGTIAYKDNTGPGTIEVLSIDAIGATILSAQNHTESGARFVIGHRIPLLIGLIVSLYVTITDGGRRAMLTIVIPPASTTPSLSAAFVAGGATLGATVVRGHPASASFTAGGASMAATASLGREVSAASFQAGDATLAVQTALGHPTTAAFAAGAASMAATVDHGHPTTAAFVAGDASMAATALRAAGVIAPFAAGAASMAVTTVRGHPTSVAFAASPGEIAAEFAEEEQPPTGGRVDETPPIPGGPLPPGPATRVSEAAPHTWVDEDPTWLP